MNDQIVQRFGTTSFIGYGGFCAATGFAVVTLVPYWPAAVLGFALVGAGCSNIVPVLFTSVGRQTVMPENLAVPTMTALGYAGVLAGPAAIGLVAQATSLSVAFLTVALMLIGVAATVACCGHEFGVAARGRRAAVRRELTLALNTCFEA